jgi:hypothetical protein
MKQQVKVTTGKSLENKLNLGNMVKTSPLVVLGRGKCYNN